jgi:hypothetical protein
VSYLLHSGLGMAVVAALMAAAPSLVEVSKKIARNAADLQLDQKSG